MDTRLLRSLRLGCSNQDQGSSHIQFLELNRLMHYSCTLEKDLGCESSSSHKFVGPSGLIHSRVGHKCWNSWYLDNRILELQYRSEADQHMQNFDLGKS